MSELPKGWKKASLEEFTFINMGQSPKSEFVNASGTGLPFYQGKTEFGKLYPTPRKYCTKPTKIAEKNDVLLSVRAPVGPTNLCPEQSCIGRGLAAIRAVEPISQQYLLHYLRYSESWLSQQGTGTTFKAITGKFLREIDIVIAPLNEQIRIADKLDSILAKVDAAQARLDKIPNILKRFRQAVLAVATSGELTKEWALNHKLKKWEKLKIENIAKIIDPQPSHRTPPVFEGGVPYIGIGDINKSGGFDFEQARKVAPTVLDEHRKRYQLKQGDFVFGKIGTIGKATLVPTNIDFTLSANLILVQPNLENTSLGYVRYFLQSPSVMGEVAKQSKSTSQSAFGIKKMRMFEILLPSMIEQKEIVRRVETLFTMADLVEKQFNETKTRTNRLAQSILAKAFCGELVAQDETDEPASILLEKIKASLIKKPAKKIKKKAPAKPKKPLSISKEDGQKEFIRYEPEKQVGIDFTDEQVKRKNWLDDNFIFAERALQNLKDTPFTTEQFQSITSFSKSYDELKTLILTLVKGTPGSNEPLFEIADWDDKTGNYSFKIKD